MNKEKQHIDSLFQQGLNNFSADPPEHIWNSIEMELSKKKKKITANFIWRSAAAAAVIALIFTTFSLYRTNINNQNIVLQTNKDKKIQNITTNSINSNRENKPVRKQTSKPEDKTALTHITQIKNLNQDLKKNINIKNLKQEKASFYSNEEMHSPGYLDSKSIALIPGNNSVDAQYAFIQNNEDKMLLKDPNADFLDNLFGAIDDKKEKNILDEISVGGLVSPTYAFRQTSGSSSANDENGITTVAGGLNLKIKTSSKFEFETGISYSQVGQDFSNSSSSVYSSLVYDDDMEIIVNNQNGKYKNSMGSIEESESDASVSNESSTAGISLKVASISNTNIEQRLDYLEVPFIAKYKLIDKKFDIAVLSGLSSNFLVGNNAYLLNDGNKSDLGGISGIHTVSFSATIGFGFQTPLTKSINLNIEPRIKYFLQSVSGSGTFKPYSFGVFTGVSYKL